MKDQDWGRTDEGPGLGSQRQSVSQHIARGRDLVGGQNVAQGRVPGRMSRLRVRRRLGLRIENSRKSVAGSADLNHVKFLRKHKKNANIRPNSEHKKSYTNSKHANANVRRLVFAFAFAFASTFRLELHTRIVCKFCGETAAATNFADYWYAALSCAIGPSRPLHCAGARQLTKNAPAGRATSRV